MSRESSLNKMTKKTILESCIKNKLYRLPHLNDVLYLHFQGYGAIENLEEYTELKCLWLESNAISEIKGLDNQKHLKCLFLQNNLIEKIENLEALTSLDTLNLCHNYIKKIENCGADKLPLLNTLNISHNCLRYANQLDELKNCTFLSVLDLSHNKIEDVVVVKILSEMPQLKVLTMTGNPVINQIPQYRKTLILECKQLTYLDSRPVFPRDRACAEAWKRGGFAEEQKEHHRWNKEERKKTRRSVNALLALRRKTTGDSNIELLRSSSDEDEDEDNKYTKSVPNNLYDDNLNLEQCTLNEWRQVEQNTCGEYCEPTKFNTNIDHTLEKRFDPLDESDFNNQDQQTTSNITNETKDQDGQVQVLENIEPNQDENENNSISSLKIPEINNKIFENVKNEATLLEIEDTQSPCESIEEKFPVKVQRSIDDDSFPITDCSESSDSPFNSHKKLPRPSNQISSEILDQIENLRLSVENAQKEDDSIENERHQDDDGVIESEFQPIISDTVLLKNFKNQTEHSCVPIIGPSLESNDIKIIGSELIENPATQIVAPALKTKRNKKNLRLPSPWKELWGSSSSDECSDTENGNEIIPKTEIKLTNSRSFTEIDISECNPNLISINNEDNSCINNPINLELQNDSSEDEIIECIENDSKITTSIKELIHEIEETESEEDSDIEECLPNVTENPIECSSTKKYSKEKEEVWEIDLQDNKINCMEKTPSEMSLVAYEPRASSFDFSKEPKDKLFLINRLLSSKSNLTYGIDNTFNVGGTSQATDMERFQAESFRERSEQLQDLCSRIYARRDEINARFDKIQALWGDFKNPYKGKSMKEHNSQGTSTADSSQSVDPIDYKKLLKDTVALVQESSILSNSYCDTKSTDPRGIDDWKSVYLLEPIQTGLMSTDIDLSKDEEKITKAIVSLIIESCVEFNMMREFQFVNFDSNLKGVVKKYRERFQKFLNYRNDKRHENVDTLMTEWRYDRGSAYDFKDIFMCEDEQVRDKIKQIIFHEYSIDLENDPEKLMHMWRMILTCKQVYLGHQTTGCGKIVMKTDETSTAEEDSSSDSE
uniref:Dynein axonemal assembly factor 1 homolog n=1 Tax=Culicoides sonorensis TaxID=179676 RepID=A0A336M5X9_CULSO